MYLQEMNLMINKLHSKEDKVFGLKDSIVLIMT